MGLWWPNDQKTEEEGKFKEGKKLNLFVREVKAKEQILYVFQTAWPNYKVGLIKHWWYFADQMFRLTVLWEKGLLRAQQVPCIWLVVWKIFRTWEENPMKMYGMTCLLALGVNYPPPQSLNFNLPTSQGVNWVDQMALSASHLLN